MRAIHITISDEDGMIFAQHEFKDSVQIDCLRRLAEASDNVDISTDPGIHEDEAVELVYELLSDVAAACRNAQ